MPRYAEGRASSKSIYRIHASTETEGKDGRYQKQPQQFGYQSGCLCVKHTPALRSMYVTPRTLRAAMIPVRTPVHRLRNTPLNPECCSSTLGGRHQPCQPMPRSDTIADTIPCPNGGICVRVWRLTLPLLLSHERKCPIRDTVFCPRAPSGSIRW